ncbi:MAG: SDR family NAD(P)-dependent oxidoreductase [Microbacteriaceae bacterium]|nr:SDR family NAD(P)-dependent oxidoreductase [Microbacteriaceae bacterium]
MTKTWFITGASRGFGREWAEAALERGDRVAATARDPRSLDALVERFGDRLLPVALDVTDREAVFAAVAAAHARFDPILRDQRGGHIVQVSSIGGITAFASLGLYNASKWALEAFTQALAQEVAVYGVKTTLVEPAAYATDWGGDSAITATPMPAYDHVRAARAARKSAQVPGDPVATRTAILAVVDAEEPPLRIFFGRGPLEIAKADYERRIAVWEAWRGVSEAAHGH